MCIRFNRLRDLSPMFEQTRMRFSAPILKSYLACVYQSCLYQTGITVSFFTNNIHDKIRLCIMQWNHLLMGDCKFTRFLQMPLSP
mmetsp:Transcript_25233/g.60685  ORF Transcript_25233/g.60685 Transcript_25233/m.60685 type:complete len:85 (-) Transcript_25233:285-539(-)